MKRFDFVWEFPLPRVHAGMLLGNARTGAMIWGADNVLNITLGRGDWWDHRGGIPWTTAMNWRDIRQALEAHDEPAIRAMFAEPETGGPPRPTLIPVGRVELVFPDNARLVRGTLDRYAGRITIELDCAGATQTVELELSMDRSLLRVSTSAGDVQVRILPAYETAGDALSQRGIAAPTRIDRDGVSGFTQTLPEDSALTVTATKRGNDVWIATALDDADGAIRAVREANTTIFDTSRAWWRAYWDRSPKLNIPSPVVQFLFDYGLYKFAGLTCPLGSAAGLQGAWIEDYTTPPWSGDYHFNINVQMCYSPAYLSGHLSHLRPLFDLIQSWMPALRDHAHKFIGIDDGVMLPHAVDDRCKIIGSFWTGTVDHGCTAWVGKMMYDYWSFGGADDAWARDVMFPFLKGAMRVFEEMLSLENDTYVLPVSVSPEYRGAAMNAWGRNASFQLACIHMLCEKLIELSARFDEPQRPAWREILAKLPRACVEDGRISLWEGTPLEESHRHHAHLAGITPFDVIDPQADQWKTIVHNSINHWIAEGMGMWSGWCMPWAVQLHTRTGNAGMSELLIEIWERIFTNEGHGTLHDCEINGLTLMGARATRNPNEIMQMDAGMGMVTAIGDLLCYAQTGVHHFFKGCPDRWETVGFEGIHVAGGFVVSGTRDKDAVKISVRATQAGTFSYADPKSGEVRRVDLRDNETRQLM